MTLAATTNFRTKTQLKATVGRFVEDTSTAMAAVIGDGLDLAWERLMTSPHLPPLVRWHDGAVTVSAGASYFHSPKHAREVLAIVDTSMPVVYQGQDPKVFVLGDSLISNISGAATSFTQVGDYGINLTIAAQALEVVSDGADVRTATIRGLKGGEYAEQTVTLNGAVAVDFTGSWDDVFQFFVSAGSTSRVVTLRKDGAAGDLATIGPNEQEAIYHRYRLNQAAGSAGSIRMVYKANPMVAASDDTPYPLPVGNYLHHAAVAYVLEKRRQGSLAQQHEARALDFLNAYLLELERQKGPTVNVPHRRETRPLAVLVIA